MDNEQIGQDVEAGAALESSVISQPGDAAATPEDTGDKSGLDQAAEPAASKDQAGDKQSAAFAALSRKLKDAERRLKLYEHLGAQPQQARAAETRPEPAAKDIPEEIIPFASEIDARVQKLLNDRLAPVDQQLTESTNRAFAQRVRDSVATFKEEYPDEDYHVIEELAIELANHYHARGDDRYRTFIAENDSPAHAAYAVAQLHPSWKEYRTERDAAVKSGIVSKVATSIKDAATKSKTPAQGGGPAAMTSFAKWKQAQDTGKKLTIKEEQELLRAGVAEYFEQ